MRAGASRTAPDLTTQPLTDPPDLGCATQTGFAEASAAPERLDEGSLSAQIWGPGSVLIDSCALRRAQIRPPCPPPTSQIV